jgi:hypothetical protein
LRLIMPFAGMIGAPVRRLRARLAAHDRYDFAVAALLVALTACVLLTFDSYAISNDEGVQQRYGEMIVAYYASGFADRQLFHFDNLYLYGGLFDTIAVLLQRAMPGVDAYTIRHLMCAAAGIAGIGLTHATARLVASPRAGAIAAFALATCGAWYGTMFNHTKDIPFAAAMIGAVYVLLRITRALPRPRWTEVAAFGVLVGCALGLRVLALLLPVYAAAGVLLAMPPGERRMRIAFVARSALAFAPAMLIGYLIMIAAWPWAAQAPLNPLRGLIEFGKFHYQIRTLLDGQLYTMAEVPRWYVPAYLAIRLPLTVLAGAALALAMMASSAGDGRRRRDIALLAFAALFPVLCQVVDRGPAFSGMRHFLFVVPALAALAGIGFDALLGAIAHRARWLAASAGTALAAALVWQAGTLVRLHPYEYLFYNQFVGGLAGANGRYVTDYWVGIMPQAVDRLEAYVAGLDRHGGPRRRYLVAVCGERLAFEKRANARLQWTADWARADFFIAPTHMGCDRALAGRVIDSIDRMNSRVGVVKDRRPLVQHDVAFGH